MNFSTSRLKRYVLDASGVDGTIWPPSAKGVNSGMRKPGT